MIVIFVTERNKTRGRVTKRGEEMTTENISSNSQGNQLYVKTKTVGIEL